jgi:hypothetical protein
MVSKIILRMALALAMASSLFAGKDVKWNGVVTPSDPMNDGWETITIPLHELIVRQPGTPLDAFDTTIKVQDFELNDGGWVSGDLSTVFLRIGILMRVFRSGMQTHRHGGARCAVVGQRSCSRWLRQSPAGVFDVSFNGFVQCNGADLTRVQGTLELGESRRRNGPV